MVILVRPHPRFHASWLESYAEFEAEGSTRFSGIPELETGEDVEGWTFTREQLEDARGFARFVQVRLDEEQPDGRRPPGWVPCTHWWMEDPEVPDRYVGGISLRHTIDHPFLSVQGGHVGYAVRPSARRRGFASDALRQVVVLAAERGIGPVLVTCEEANLASARTIESQGGVYDDTREGKRRYWVG